MQAALLKHRLDLVEADPVCDLVAATAVRTGPSARNLARHGFALVYAQLVMSAP